MRSALLACLPLTEGSSGSRVLSDFDEVCQSHGVVGRAFRVVADPFLATRTAKACCLPEFLFPSPNGQNEDGDKEGCICKNVEDRIQNDHSDNVKAGEWDDSWEQGLGACRVDCFTRSLEQCVRMGICSCPQFSSTLAKAACFYNYITSAVPPEKLSQVFDRPGNDPPAVRDWAAQLKVLLKQFLIPFSQAV